MNFRLPSVLYPMIAAACWGGNFAVGRAVGPDIPPLSLAFWRWVLASAILAPIVWPHLRPHLGLVRGNFVLLLALSVLGTAMFQSFVYLGLQTTTTINAALFMSVIPLAIPLTAYLIDRERASVRLLIGILVSLSGVAVVTAQADLAVLAELAINPGDLWVLASVPVWAVYSVMLKRLPPSLPPMVVLFVISFLGALVLLPFYVWEAATVGGFALSVGNLAAVGYVAVFAALVAFTTWNRGVAELGASRAGVFLHLIPVFAAALAVVFLGERFQSHHAIGIPLVVLGLWIASRAKHRIKHTA